MSLHIFACGVLLVQFAHVCMLSAQLALGTQPIHFTPCHNMESQKLSTVVECAHNHETDIFHRQTYYVMSVMAP